LLATACDTDRSLITSVYDVKHCTRRYQDTREDQVDQELTEGAQSTKTYKRWGSPGKKQRWQFLTDTDGVGVWPNVSSWMRDASRSTINIITAVLSLMGHTRSYSMFVLGRSQLNLVMTMWAN